MTLIRLSYEIHDLFVFLTWPILCFSRDGCLESSGERAMFEEERGVEGGGGEGGEKKRRKGRRNKLACNEMGYSVLTKMKQDISELVKVNCSVWLLSRPMRGPFIINQRCTASHHPSPSDQWVNCGREATFPALYSCDSTAKLWKTSNLPD